LESTLKLRCTLGDSGCTGASTVSTFGDAGSGFSTSAFTDGSLGTTGAGAKILRGGSALMALTTRPQSPSALLFCSMMVLRMPCVQGSAVIHMTSTHLVASTLSPEPGLSTMVS